MSAESAAAQGVAKRERGLSAPSAHPRLTPEDIFSNWKQGPFRTPSVCLNLPRFQLPQISRGESAGRGAAPPCALPASAAPVERTHRVLLAWPAHPPFGAPIRPGSEVVAHAVVIGVAPVLRCGRGRVEAVKGPAVGEEDGDLRPLLAPQVIAPGPHRCRARKGECARLVIGEPRALRGEACTPLEPRRPRAGLFDLARDRPFPCKIAQPQPHSRPFALPEGAAQSRSPATLPQPRGPP
ncbi:hypothetical protein SDC9_18906 [bioreactor metagenome]|uniref:Uncharacterized protein n=1 Tax=bioreactor metagenome TaxID=1076179 RepID=A0A644U1J6_9ZZZZ